MKMFAVLLVLVLSAPVSAQTLAERTTQIIEGSNEYVDMVTQRVFCPECKAEGKRSSVHIISSYSTAMACPGGYYDEDGFYVAVENCNKTYTLYQCSNGHSFEEAR